jgi:nucleoid-associated protein YgaU
MTTRFPSSPILCALAFSFVVATTFPVQAQTAAPADTSSSNAAPAAPAPATAAPAAAAAPVGAPADTNAASSAAPEERPTSYTIVKGDSLWSIAHKYGTTVVKLRKLNKLKMHALLHPGQVLQLPPVTSDTTTK